MITKDHRTLSSESDLSPIPTRISSSCSDSDDNGSGRKPGEISPQSTCNVRKLSVAIVSDTSLDNLYVEGRPRRLLPKLTRSLTESAKKPYLELISNPSPLRLDAWSEEPAENFNVRSSSYLTTSLKVPSASSLFSLLTVDLVAATQPHFGGLCTLPHERIQRALQLEAQTGCKELPEFIFAVNLCIPGNNSTSSGNGKKCYHWVAYFGLEDKTVLTNPTTPEGKLCQEFFFGPSDAFRNQTFKLIPRIADGNFVVRKAVGSKPSLLGKKLKQYYVRTDRFFEIVIHIGSDSVAQRIVKLALGYAKNLTVDMMFLLEAKTVGTLPERILGGVRVKNIDFKRKDGQRVL